MKSFYALLGLLVLLVLPIAVTSDHSPTTGPKTEIAFDYQTAVILDLDPYTDLETGEVLPDWTPALIGSTTEGHGSRVFRPPAAVNLI